MLKGDQFANTVKQDNRISIQVNHLVKPHHPDIVLNSMYLFSLIIYLVTQTLLSQYNRRETPVCYTSTR